jgi:excinuclease UvrABC ATPase subunit
MAVSIGSILRVKRWGLLINGQHKRRGKKMKLTCQKCKHKWEVMSGMLARHPRPLSKCPECKGQGTVNKVGLRSLIARDYTTRLVGRLGRSDKNSKTKDKVMKTHFRNQKERIDAKMNSLGY